MTTSSLSSHSRLQDLLGPSPLVAGLFMWVLGVVYCVVAWHVNATAPIPGLALMGLAPFVNLFCFFRGLTHLRRAWMRRKTSRVARQLRLTPSWGSGSAGFFLVDETRGFCVINGLSASFADIESLKRTSTFMAHTLELVRRNATPRTTRFVIGFSDETALELAATRLHQAISNFTNQTIPLTEEDLRTE